MKIRDYILLILLIGVSLGVFIFYKGYQQELEYSKCSLCDAHQYRRLFISFSEMRSIPIHFPFNSRILLPFISAKTQLSFKFYNLIFAILTISTLYIIWKKLSFKPILILFGLFWLLFHWSGIVRYYAFDPISVDVPVYFFHALLVLIIITKKYKWLFIVAPIALLTKESFLAYMLIIAIFTWLYNLFVEQYFHIRIIFIALGLTIFTKIIVGIYFPPIEEGMNSFRSVAFYVRGILQNPLEIFRWIVTIFTAFGGLFSLSLTSVRKNFKSNPEQNLILVLSIISILFGLIAGGDRTRIMFIGFPFIMTSIFYLVQNRGIGVIIASILLSIPIMRIASTIPQPTAYNYFDWYPEFADLSIVCAWAFYMFFSYYIIKKVDSYFSK